MITKKSLYKIIFDTNIIWLNDEDKISKLFNSSINESVKFIKDNSLSKNITIAIPEVVLQERIEQTLCQIKEVVKKIENGINALSGFGIKISEKNYKKNFKKKILENLDKILNKSEIEILKTPKFNQRKLIERSLKKIKPFNGDGDKGFKDTLLWLTVIDDVKKCKDINYILCTNNIIDFNIEELSTEFKNLGKGDFNIVGNLKDLKQFLDKELDLKLELKELYKQIDNEVKLKIGDLMVHFNAEKIKNNDYSSELSFHDVHYNTSLAGRFLGSTNDEDNIVGYDFKDINIQDINELKKGVFEIRADLIVKPRYKKDNNRLSAYKYNYLYEEIKKQTHSITFRYNRSTESINLVLSNKVLAYLDNIDL